MRRTGGLLAIALVLGLVGCASAKDQRDSARYDAMLEVEKVPGVLVAPYPYRVQVDPAASEQEIVTTALAVRDILDGLGSDRPPKVELIAVYPGDGSVATEFTTRVFDDPDRFERDVSVWAGLLDDGFSQVRFNVFDEAGDGVLSVQSGEPGEPGPTLDQSFDAMVAALGDDPSVFQGLQTEASLDRTLATNRSGQPALPTGWGDALNRLATLPYISKSHATFNPDATALSLRGSADLSAEQNAEIMAIIAAAGVLQPSLNVTYNTGFKGALVTLYGAAQ
jgi:hypothetical protein